MKRTEGWGSEDWLTQARELSYLMKLAAEGAGHDILMAGDVAAAMSLGAELMLECVQGAIAALEAEALEDKKAVAT